jgi:hypothetical protein
MCKSPHDSKRNCHGNTINGHSLRLNISIKGEDYGAGFDWKMPAFVVGAIVMVVGRAKMIDIDRVTTVSYSAGVESGLHGLTTGRYRI